MPAHHPFDAPYNWCDSRCPRCALSDTCPVARNAQRRHWRHRALGRDADPPPAVMEDVAANLREAHTLLEPLARQPLDVAPLRPIPLGRKQLERAALQLARCVVRLDAAGELPQERGSECLQLCIQLAGKTARVTSHLGSVDADVWDCDAVPNLLLIELTAARLRHALGPLQDAQTCAALDALERLLAPLLARVGRAAREEMARLVRAGRAPSPFLVAMPV